MKRLLFFIIISAVFFSIFFKSDTWETYRRIETKMGIDYTVIEYRLNWSNFFGYLNYLYRIVIDRLPIPTK